jgi:hypothetical protein
LLARICNSAVISLPVISMGRAASEGGCWFSLCRSKSKQVVMRTPRSLSSGMMNNWIVPIHKVSCPYALKIPYGVAQDRTWVKNGSAQHKV